jgi:thiamine-phosphate diphosphorylase
MLRLRSPIYVILNHMPGRCTQTLALLEACLGGGAGMLQFRAKEELSGEDLACLRTMVGKGRAAGVPLIVNDRADLAREIGSDGVHVGLRDDSVASARKMLGPGRIVGATTPTPEIARAAERDGASYVAVGSVYPSPTRPNKTVVGVERVREVAAAVGVPVCAIGGITAERGPGLLAAGAALLCVISAVSEALDPLEAVRELVEACQGPGAQPFRA